MRLLAFQVFIGSRLSGAGSRLGGTLAILKTLLNSKRLNIYLKEVNIIHSLIKNVFFLIYALTFLDPQK